MDGQGGPQTLGKPPEDLSKSYEADMWHACRVGLGVKVDHFFRAPRQKRVHLGVVGGRPPRLRSRFLKFYFFSVAVQVTDGPGSALE